MYAASALAANTVARSACGAAAPLFTQYMFNALGIGGGGSLIGGVAVLLAIIPFAFYRYGGAIRERSKFAPTAPPKPAEEDNEDKDVEKETHGSGDSSSNTTLAQSPVRHEKAARKERGEREEEEREEEEELENAF